MTIICAIHQPGIGTWVGSDTQATLGDTPLPTVATKWLRAGPWFIGHAGHPRALQLARKRWEGLAECRDAFDLATALRDMMRDDGFLPDKEDGAPADYGQRWLLARWCGLWDCDGAGNVAEIMPGAFWARGSGRDYALGAAYAIGGLDRDPEDVIVRAVTAACAFDSGCGGEPFVRFLPKG